MAKEVDSTGRVVVDTTTKERAELKQDQIHAFGPDPSIPRCQGSIVGQHRTGRVTRVLITLRMMIPLRARERSQVAQNRAILSSTVLVLVLRNARA